MVGENCLTMHVSLDLEHELPPGHAIRDFERLLDFRFLPIVEVETEHEGLLLQMLILLVLKICDVGVL